MVAKLQNLTISGHGHVANNIKGNHKFSNMVANILFADPPPPYLHPDPGDGVVKRSKIKLLRNNVMLHIKLKGITKLMQHYGRKKFAADCSISNPGVEGQKVKLQVYQNTFMVDIKLKRIMNAAT